jgi:hypothetical protein
MIVTTGGVWLRYCGAACSPDTGFRPLHVVVLEMNSFSRFHNRPAGRKRLRFRLSGCKRVVAEDAGESPIELARI